jgi:LPXTG-motif cell wall-anchored protein
VDNVMVRATKPGGVASSFQSTITISSANADPATITDTATVNLDEAAELSYIPGSAELIDVSGNRLMTLGDSLFTSGVNIGTIGVSTQEKRFVQFSANVVCQPTPPPTPSYVCNRLNIQKLSRTRFEFTTAYSLENATYDSVTYQVDGQSYTVSNADTKYTYETDVVGTHTVRSRVTVNTADGVRTTNWCEGEFTVDEPPVPPTESVRCDRLNIGPVNRTRFVFSTSYALNNMTFGNVVYRVNGATVATVTDPNTVYQYDQTTPGTYAVEAIVTANGSTDSKTSTCTDSLVVEPVTPVTPEYICRTLTADRRAIQVGNSVRFAVTPHIRGNVEVTGAWMDFGDGQTTTPTTGLNFEHRYDRVGDYTAKAYLNFLVDGQARDNVTSVECEQTIAVTEEPPVPPVPVDPCLVPGKENLDADDPNCVSDSPVTPGGGSYGPSQLPATGAETGLASAIGLGSLVTGTAYYVTSRRRLGKL